MEEARLEMGDHQSTSLTAVKELEEEGHSIGPSAEVLNAKLMSV